ncbi:MFS family permease [Actinoplanes lutulentus]|uniref:MFS transporter n=1 Tax=Actinoplanes lutulentus TaxID=1287878 RepID=A0A327ZJY6_9ACTN|nr:MFS transporter [Actinoplanes lutulentus]MBB2944462.1 MFS family permease [Actinoplanes lutulentus]RAK42306.1 MFS transporter [Actinoplanes lutulentus]
MSTTPRAGRLAGLVVAICWLVVLFDGVDLFIYGAVLPGMLDDPELGLTPAAAGGLGSYATFGMLLGALASGPLTDRIGRKKMIIAVPLVARFLPESPSFLIARGRTDEATAIATRYGVEVPTAAPARSSLALLFAGGRWKQTVLFWCTSFGGLLLVYGVNTWLPTMMRAEGYDLGSALAFLIVINLGGIVGMLVAGRVADRFGAVRVAAVWFALTAVGVYLLGVRTPLAVTYLIVFLAGVFLFSAQTMVYATVTARYSTANRATAVGSTAGIGRFGAVFGPWLGGQLVASNNQGWGFTAFAVTAMLATIFALLAGLAGGSKVEEEAPTAEPVAAH